MRTQGFSVHSKQTPADPLRTIAKSPAGTAQGTAQGGPQMERVLIIDRASGPRADPRRADPRRADRLPTLGAPTLGARTALFFPDYGDGPGRLRGTNITRDLFGVRDRVE